MLKKFLNKFKKQNSKNYDYVLARSFNDEVAFRNYMNFITHYTKYYENLNDGVDLPPRVKAQNLFVTYKKTGYLDELNRPCTHDYARVGSNG